MHIRRLAIAGAAALLLAGCGGSDGVDGAEPGAASSSSEAGSSLSRMSGEEVAEASFKALEEAGAAHVQGTITEAGQEQALDLHLQDEDAIGSLTMDGVTLQLVFTGGTSYIQAPGDFWAASGVPEEAAASLDGVWILLPPDAATEFGALTLSGLVDELRTPEDDNAITGDVTTDELDGQPVVVVTQEDGSTLEVADSGPSYPLRLVDKGDAPGTVTFSRFGERVTITAPAGALDLSEFGA
ncbi:MAG TPA: hypothetical protein VK402_02010 [Blastococcus sp.]|nr:hypothetical protein [Blastococcus sp.]